MLLTWGVQNYLHSILFSTYAATYIVNRNPSQVEFSCPKLVNPLESRAGDSVSVSDSGKKKTPTTMKMHLTFWKIKRHFQHFFVISDIWYLFYLFLSSYFCFLKSIPKLHFHTFCFISPFLSPNWFWNVWIG